MWCNKGRSWLAWNEREERACPCSDSGRDSHSLTLPFCNLVPSRSFILIAFDIGTLQMFHGGTYAEKPRVSPRVHNMQCAFRLFFCYSSLMEECGLLTRDAPLLLAPGVPALSFGTFDRYPLRTDCVSQRPET